MAPTTNKDRGSYAPYQRQVVDVDFPSFLAPNALQAVARVLGRIGYPDVAKFVKEVAGLNPHDPNLPIQYYVINEVEKNTLIKALGGIQQAEYKKGDLQLFADSGKLLCLVHAHSSNRMLGKRDEIDFIFADDPTVIGWHNHFLQNLSFGGPVNYHPKVSRLGMILPGTELMAKYGYENLVAPVKGIMLLLYLQAVSRVLDKRPHSLSKGRLNPLPPVQQKIKEDIREARTVIAKIVERGITIASESLANQASEGTVLDQDKALVIALTIAMVHVAACGLHSESDDVLSGYVNVTQGFQAKVTVPVIDIVGGRSSCDKSRSW